jgi:SAM-dependent methyltransferase
VLEIGAGSGLATRRLAALGAGSILALEPDPRFRALLIEIPRVSVRHSTLEEGSVPDDSFDLAVCATTFHWLDADETLSRVARALRPGGWWAAWWNVFGDPEQEDPFHEATEPILRPLADGPSFGSEVPFALDVSARRAELEAVEVFEQIGFERWDWTLELDPEQVRALYATYSSISRLEPDRRREVLDAVAEVASSAFGGRVQRRMVTPLYTARRR